MHSKRILLKYELRNYIFSYIFNNLIVTKFLNIYFIIYLQFDAEILYWETKNREQMHQMDFISQEVNRMETTGRLIEEQVCISYNMKILCIIIMIVIVFVFIAKRTSTCRRRK